MLYQIKSPVLLDTENLSCPERFCVGVGSVRKFSVDIDRVNSRGDPVGNGEISLAVKLFQIEQNQVGEISRSDHASALDVTGLPLALLKKLSSAADLTFS